MIAPFLTGFATGFSLILAIGAQNAFILRQGMLRQHVFALCLFAAISDAVLIAAGVAGFGVLMTTLPWLSTVMLLGGAVFLIFYGLTRFWAAWRGEYALGEAAKSGSLMQSLTIIAAFTWLNPHVYLDTMALIGAISLQYETTELRWAFGSGAITASFVFFFSLGYGARFLTPIMQSQRAWRVLDIIIGFVMWAIAVKLLLELAH